MQRLCTDLWSPVVTAGLPGSHTVVPVDRPTMWQHNGETSHSVNL